jgi:hypothetical protein
MAKQEPDLAKLCEALGVERVNEVTRVVVDIQAGHHPMVLVERIGDAEKITAALTGPNIEVEYRTPKPVDVPTADSKPASPTITTTEES